MTAMKFLLGIGWQAKPRKRYGKRSQTHSYQEHGGLVNTSTTPKVEYSYASGTTNTIRMTGMVYPDGRSLVQSYGTANGMNDVSSRVESMKFSTEGFNLVDYQYLGSSGFVNAASGQPGISWTLIGSGNDPESGDIYWGLDRFGRVDKCLWKTSSATLAQIEYGYDRASNRTWRKDGVLSGYDELYSYDGLYRLTDQQRGTLNGTHTAITSGTFQQQWGLDATGNWKTFKQDNDGNGTWELNQTRTANKVNEITNVTNSAGAAWATPSYDEAGNMVGIPNPPATTTGSTPAWNPFTESQWNNFTVAQWNAFTLDSGTVPTQLSARYDAWNRLVEIRNGATSLVENVYDARGYRIRKDTYVTGTLSESRHYYYTPGWQCVEERLDTSTTAERQFVWGLRYIDDLIVRDRSTANNGTMNARLYGMQDGNWNMIAVCDTTGSVTERYAYSAYGAPVFMTGAGTVQTGSASDFETLYAGYRWDGDSPQMYCVRNRFLLPMIGTWNRRDPLGYVDGITLLSYASAAPIDTLDPSGLYDRPAVTDPIDNSPRACIIRLLNDGEYAALDFDSACNYWLSKNPGARAKCPSFFRKQRFPPRAVIGQGCVGITQCFVGRPIFQNTKTDFKACFSTLDAAKSQQRKWNKLGKCSMLKNVNGDPAKAVIFAYRWDEASIPLLPGQIERVTCETCGQILWNDTQPSRGCSFDFGYYDEELDAFWHATCSEGEGGQILVNTPKNFVGDNRSTVYCVTCEGNAILE
jgi:RHS repeat-associated protein